MDNGALAESGARQVESLNAPVHPGAPTLIVRDLDRVAAYYEERIGLGRIDADSDTVRLGAGGVALLVLRKRQSAEQEPPGLAGLYHTAFLVPSRAELGAWLRKAIETQLPFDGAADHLVSESLYLSDPEGNGIEVYADRPRGAWTWAKGAIAMSTEPLDMQGLLSTAGDEPWRGFPEGGIVGHVHLQVGALPRAEAFYAGVLGLDITTHYTGATFYSWGGYHHHIATNIWNSRNAPPRTEPTTGLADVEIVAPTPEMIAGIRARGPEAGAPVEDTPQGARLSDPWRTSITLRQQGV